MSEMRTYQTRLDLSIEQAALLDAYAALYGKAERSLFARLSAGESLRVLKREFIGGFGMTAAVQGARGRSAREDRVGQRSPRPPDRVREAPDQAGRGRARGDDGQVEASPERRRIATRKARLANLERERDGGKMGIGFGSRKLFREPFALEKNDFASHEEWPQSPLFTVSSIIGKYKFASR
jgi:hypothetical protein